MEQMLRNARAAMDAADAAAERRGEKTMADIARGINSLPERTPICVCEVPPEHRTLINPVLRDIGFEPCTDERKDMPEDEQYRERPEYRADNGEAPHVDPQQATWSCKIGEVPRSILPQGADSPLRDAVAEAFQKLTGREPQFTFSGWGAELTEQERAVVEKREPKYEQPDTFSRRQLLVALDNIERSLEQARRAIAKL